MTTSDKWILDKWKNGTIPRNLRLVKSAAREYSFLNIKEEKWVDFI